MTMSEEVSRTPLPPGTAQIGRVAASKGATSDGSHRRPPERKGAGRRPSLAEEGSALVGGDGSIRTYTRLKTDEAKGELWIEVIDAVNGEVIQEIRPQAVAAMSEEMRRYAARAARWSGGEQRERSQGDGGKPGD